MLGAVIVFAAAKLIDTASGERWRKAARPKCVIAAITTLFVITIGVLQAIIVAVVLSVADVIRRAARPADAVLGWSSDSGRYVDVTDDTDAGVTPGVVVYRIQDRHVLRQRPLLQAASVGRRRRSPEARPPRRRRRLVHQRHRRQRRGRRCAR